MEPRGVKVRRLFTALLREQAHIEFAGGVDIDVAGLDEVACLARVDGTVDQIEEHAADAWAIRQFRDSGRVRIAKAASFFLLNQWFYDYVSFSRDDRHPPAFNRLQYLNGITGELKTQDPTFSEFMLRSLNQQHLLRDAFHQRERSDRYAKALRYARRMALFDEYPALVEAVCRMSEEVGTGGLA